MTSLFISPVYAQEIYQNEIDGFRVEVPIGWVVQDYDNTELRGAEDNFGAALLADVCEQRRAIPDIGGGYRCASTGIDRVSILRFAGLSLRPELSVVSGEITAEDFLAYFLQYMERRIGIQNISLQENEDREINVVDAQTGEVVDTVPGFYIEATSRDEDRIVPHPVLLVFDSARDTGYALLITTSFVTFFEDLVALPTDHEQVFNSFELLAPPSTPIPPRSPPVPTTPTVPPQQQPEQQPPSPSQQTRELVL